MSKETWPVPRLGSPSDAIWVYRNIAVYWLSTPPRFALMKSCTRGPNRTTHCNRIGINCIELMWIVCFTIGSKRFKKRLNHWSELVESSVESCLIQHIENISPDSSACLVICWLSPTVWQLMRLSSLQRQTFWLLGGLDVRFKLKDRHKKYKMLR